MEAYLEIAAEQKRDSQGGMKTAFVINTIVGGRVVLRRFRDDLEVARRAANAYLQADSRLQAIREHPSVQRWAPPVEPPPPEGETAAPTPEQIALQEPWWTVECNACREPTLSAVGEGACPGCGAEEGVRFTPALGRSAYAQYRVSAALQELGKAGPITDARGLVRLDYTTAHRQALGEILTLFGYVLIEEL